MSLLFSFSLGSDANSDTVVMELRFFLMLSSPTMRTFKIRLRWERSSAVLSVHHRAFPRLPLHRHNFGKGSLFLICLYTIPLYRIGSHCVLFYLGKCMELGSKCVRAWVW